MIVYKVEQTETDFLHNQLMDLLANSKINDAEEVLFENVDTDNINYLLVAVDFYSKLNEFDYDYLSKCNFSREEIYDGLSALSNMKINFSSATTGDYAIRAASSVSECGTW